MSQHNHLSFAITFADMQFVIAMCNTLLMLIEYLEFDKPHAMEQPTQEFLKKAQAVVGVAGRVAP